MAVRRQKESVSKSHRGKNGAQKRGNKTVPLSRRRAAGLGRTTRDRRIPDPALAGLRHSRRLRHPRRFCTAVLRNASGKPDPRDRHSPRRLRGLCGGWLRPHQRHGGRVRHVLRRRFERRQFHRRRLCREIACDRDQRRSGHRRAPFRSAVAPPRPRFQHAAGGLRENHGRFGTARRSPDGFSRDRSLLRRGRPLQAARLSRASSRPRSQPGTLPAPGTSREAGQRSRRPQSGRR